jgi:hypothetical protein
VAYTLLFVYALRQHAQHLFYPRSLTLACPSFLMVADIKGNVGATRETGLGFGSNSSTVGGIIFGMDENRRWLMAWSRFEAIRKNPPTRWDEGAVSEFHHIVDSLEEASGEDLSSFRVPESELKHEIIALQRPTGRRPGRKIMSEKRYVDEQFMHRQIEGVASYFQNLQSPPPPRKIGF